MYSVLLGWLAALFAVMAALLTLAAVVVGWPVLLLAVPLAGVAYLFWYHATGRLTERLRQQARHGAGGETAGQRRRRASATGFGPQNDGRWRERGTDWRDKRRRAQRRTEAGRRGARGRRTRRRGFGTEAGGSAGYYGQASSAQAGMSPDRARGVLGVRSDADADAVRDAYREKVKETHPDRGGSTESFKRVNEAYETLTGAA
ncbi:DnaJ domain-containing protein [Salinarchaeum laminariae]|uniref:DnaJ domain-containing protein n=1 Tax=Salinarchaeum laminariae TaxID=869888 RepID=UPI0020C181D2|nr:J domain-containing protein [Salinarchaeum laminariae]